MASEPNHYVSRGGLKLEAALDAFSVDVGGAACADLGASVGGFTDCLIQRGAARVYAIDTAYGQFAWRLRQDERVTLLERTNALHFDPVMIGGFSGCDLVVIDLGWTRQRLAIPAALRWLRDGEAARIVTLIKPQYESHGESARGGGRGAAILDEAAAEQVARRVMEEMATLGVRVVNHIVSPIRGGGKRGRTGNVEYLALCARIGDV